nr:hypothetical protein [Tanacetum cinerariifolium]
MKRQMIWGLTVSVLALGVSAAYAASDVNEGKTVAEYGSEKVGPNRTA